MWSLKTSGMEALAGYWALENPVADRLKPRFRVHLEFLLAAATAVLIHSLSFAIVEPSSEALSGYLKAQRDMDIHSPVFPKRRTGIRLICGASSFTIVVCD